MAKRFNNLDDCRRFLAMILNKLHDGEVEPAVAGKIIYGVNVMRSIMEAGDLEERIRRLEEQLKEVE